MKVYDRQLGRLGNVFFRYIASTLFCILYNAERANSVEQCDLIITDDIFFSWYKNLLHQESFQIPLNHSYLFDGYYQHDEIYKKYKKELVTWIQTHPNEVLKTDGDIPFFKSIDILANSDSFKIYDTVVH